MTLDKISPFKNITEKVNSSNSAKAKERGNQMYFIGILKTIAIICLIVLFSFTTTAAQAINGEIKITEKSDLSHKPHKIKKAKKKRTKNKNSGKKKPHQAKKKKKRGQQASLSQQTPTGPVAREIR